MANFASYFKVMAEGIERFSLFPEVLGIFLMFCLGLMIIQFGLLNKVVLPFLGGFRGRERGFIKVFPSKECFGGTSDVRIKSLDFDSMKSMEKSKEMDGKGKNESKGDRGNGKRGGFVGDDESDVTALRKLVRKERNRANVACADLEKERMAAASATEEAMAMILRLQSEKSAIEISANQFRRMAEKKEEYDQDNIQLLQWLVMKYVSDIKSLEDQLLSYKQKSVLYMENDALDVDDLPG